MVERALLVRFYLEPGAAVEAESLLEELGELVQTLGIEVVELVLSKCREMHKKFLCGTGKAAEIAELARAHELLRRIADGSVNPRELPESAELLSRTDDLMASLSAVVVHGPLTRPPTAA